MADTQKKYFVFEADKPGRTILWPCSILVPVDNGVEERLLTPRFSLDHVNEAEHEALWNEAAQKPDGDNYVLGIVLKGFHDLRDETGAAVPDDVAIKLALSKRYIITGLLNGYLNMRVGRLPKNFVPPPSST